MWSPRGSELLNLSLFAGFQIPTHFASSVLCASASPLQFSPDVK